MSDNILDISVKNAALKILIIVVVILTFMYGSYYILNFYNDRKKSSNTTSSSEETSHMEEEQQPQYYPVQEMHETPVVQEIIANPITQETTEINTMEETPILKNPTKTIYNKYETIDIPSSYKDATGGYISAHDVCFLHKAGEREYTSKRPKCMACQVDLSNNGKNKHNNTNTNIIKSCPYSFDGSNNTNTKEKCIELCKKYEDL